MPISDLTNSRRDMFDYLIIILDCVIWHKVHYYFYEILMCSKEIDSICLVQEIWQQ